MSGRETQGSGQPGDPFDPDPDTYGGTDPLAVWEGTSFAAAQVSGMVANLLLAEPDMTPSQVTTRVRSASAGAYASGHGLTDQQVAAIHDRSASARGVPRDTQWRRRAEVDRLRADAHHFAADRLGDPLFVAGTVLYWGQGAKTHHPLAMTNADPAALRVFVSWTRTFHDSSAAFVLSLHLHEGNDDEVARRWWRDALELDRANFTKSYIEAAGTGHRKNHLTHGVCKVRMRRSADAWHRTLAWIDVVAAELGRKA